MASKATLLLIEPQTDQSQSLTALLDEAYQVISAVDEQAGYFITESQG